MMTADDIEALRAKLREAKGLEALQRFGHELLLHAPELLARADAWERVMDAHSTPHEFGSSVVRELDMFNAAATKGFKP